MKKWMAGVLCLCLCVALTLMPAPAPAHATAGQGVMPGQVFTAGMRARLTTQTSQLSLRGSYYFLLAVSGTTAGSEFRLRWNRPDGTTFLTSPVLGLPQAVNQEQWALTPQGQAHFPMSSWTGWGASAEIIIGVGYYLEVEVIKGQFTTQISSRFTTMHVPYVQAADSTGVPVPSAGVGIIRWHIQSAVESAVESDVQAWDTINGRWINAVQWPYPAVYDRLTMTFQDHILLRVRNMSTIRVITGGRTVHAASNLPTDGTWTEVTIPKNEIVWRMGFAVSVFRGLEPFTDDDQFDILVQYTEPGTRGYFITPTQGERLQTQMIGASGGIFDLPVGAAPVIRLFHPSSNSARDIPIVVESGWWQAQIEALATGDYTLTLAFFLDGQFHAVDTVNIVIAELNHFIPPPTPHGQGLYAWLSYGVETIIFWIVYPFRAIALLVQQASQNLGALVSNTGAFFRLMSTFWGFLPNEMSAGLAVAAPLLLVLWAVKR